MWLKIDDKWCTHPKIRRAGLHGRALWIAAGSMAARDSTEGVVDDLLLDDAVRYADADRDEAVAALIRCGLWHDTKTLRKCEPCKKAIGRLPAGSYYFHDWLEYQFTRDEAKIPEVRMRKMRSKRLSRDMGLREAIVDRDQGLCRYCAIRVDFTNRVGGTGGTYDHVNPAGDNTLENVVVACRTCNGRKRDRTPDEAGMPLLPIPSRVLAPARPGSDGGQAEGYPSRARDARDGTGRSGVGPGSGLGLAPDRLPVLNGHGSNGHREG